MPFQGNRQYVSSPSSQPGTLDAPHLVQIDKGEITSVEIGKYTLTEEVQYMPLVSKVRLFRAAVCCFWTSISPSPLPIIHS